MQIPNVIAIGMGLNHKIDQYIVHVLFLHLKTTLPIKNKLMADKC